MIRIRSVIRAVTPAGLLDFRRALMARRTEARQSALRAEFQREREKRLRSFGNRMSPAHLVNAEDYEAIVTFLVSKGIPEFHVRAGSMPRDSLEYLDRTIFDRIGSQLPSRVLHIGNFVGVSLAHIAYSITKINSKSIVVAIDPNITHRGVENPQHHVMELLCACGLQRNVIAIVGYSLQANISNDGGIFDGYDPSEQYYKEKSCENVLENLNSVMLGKFDMAFIDGNHDPDYLRNEIRNIVPLLSENGWIILDDVDENWKDIKQVFCDISEFGLAPVGTNGRVGIARRKGANFTAGARQ